MLTLVFATAATFAPSGALPQGALLVLGDPVRPFAAAPRATEPDADSSHADGCPEGEAYTDQRVVVYLRLHRRGVVRRRGGERHRRRSLRSEEGGRNRCHA